MTADRTSAMSLIEHQARLGRPFSANDIRDQLRHYGYTRFNTGRLFQYAEAQGVIVQVGLTRSTERSTRSRVCEWIGTEHYRRPAETVPVRRDRAGRFVHDGTKYTDVPLFDVEMGRV